MKKYIMASIISIFPVFIGISILLTTMLMLVRYVNAIDRLDETELLAYEKKQELEKLIRKYNTIILQTK